MVPYRDNRRWIKLGWFVGILTFVTVNGIASPTCYAQDNRLRILTDDAEALQARIDLIQRAENSIDVAYYSVDTDQVPVALLELLRQASVRGVRVRILVDGLIFRVPAKFEKYLRRFGVNIRVYHQPHQGNLRWLNRRLHSKLIVVDDSVAIIGSRNLENEYYQFHHDRNFVDCDALVSGDVAKRAKVYFDRLWCTPDVSRAPDHDSLRFDALKYSPTDRTEWNLAWRHAKGPADYQQLLCRSLQQVTSHCNVRLNSNRDWMADSLHGVDVDLLHDCLTDKSKRIVQQRIVQLMDSARRSLLIESPYPAFDRPIRQAISRARSRGVQVTLLTNSLRSTDQVNVYAAYQNQKRGLLKEGVQLREFSSNDILHAKTMIVDNRSCMLGSYNFDGRSDTLNLELCIVSNDPVVTNAVRDSVQTRLAKSTRIAAGRLWLSVGPEGTASKRIRMALKRGVVELYRRSL